MFTVYLLMALCTPTQGGFSCSDPATFDSYEVKSQQICDKEVAEFRADAKGRRFIETDTGIFIIFGADCKNKL